MPAVAEALPPPPPPPSPDPEPVEAPPPAAPEDDFVPPETAPAPTEDDARALADGIIIWEGEFDSGMSLVGGALLQPSTPKNRSAAATQLQLGEQPRQAVLGRAAKGWGEGDTCGDFLFGAKSPAVSRRATAVSAPPSA